MPAHHILIRDENEKDFPTISDITVAAFQLME